MKRLLALFLIFILIGCQTQGEFRELKMQTASEIANLVKDLPKIDSQDFYTYEGFRDATGNINLVLKIINEKTDSDFGQLGKELSDYEKFMSNIDRYLPVIDNYNGLIEAANNLNLNDEENVNHFYIKAIVLGGEITLIAYGAFYKTAYKITGTLTNALGLTKMSRFCGPCVSEAMSEIHWFIRNELTDATSNVFEELVNK